jgi:hypothetical protein
MRVLQKLLEGSQMSFVPTKECVTHPGYYHVPDNDVVAVNPDGRFINLLTGKSIKSGPIYDGYWKISCNIAGKTHNWYVHRLMARTFINKPLRHRDKDYSELEVNHKNGDKSDNSLDNLEWLTPSENVNHSLDNFLTSYTPVLAKNLTNGVILSFPTTLACSKTFGISNRRLRKHLKAKEAGTRTKNWFVFKYDDGTTWPTLREKDYQQDTWDAAFGVWFAKHEETGKTYYHRTLEELCDTLGLVYTATQSAFTRCGEERRYAGYLFWYDDRPVKDVIENLSSDRKVPEGIREPMKIKVVTGDKEETFDSVTKAAKAMGVASSGLLYAINKRQGKFKNHIVSYV